MFNLSMITNFTVMGISMLAILAIGIIKIVFLKSDKTENNWIKEVEVKCVYCGG